MKLKILLPGIQKVTLLRLKTPKRCLESGGNPLVSGLPLTSLRWNRKSLKDAHFLHLYINNIIIQVNLDVWQVFTVKIIISHSSFQVHAAHALME